MQNGVDLGSARSLTEIRLQLSRIGAADQYTIQVSNDGSSCQTLATRGNASAAGVWQTLATTASARYVRFSFANPNRDRRLGYLSEVQIFGIETAQRSANVGAESRREDDALQAGPPAISSQDGGAGASRGRKQKQNRIRRGGRRRRG